MNIHLILFSLLISFFEHQSFANPINRIHFYDRSRIKIHSLGEGIYDLKDIPLTIKQAFLAAEDEHFYNHKGISPSAILRAMIANIKAGRVVQGASTITQQLARSLYLTRDKTFSRKIKEAIMALSLEKTHSKEEILKLYLNHIYLGLYEHGIERACLEYFGKSAHEISYAQAALIAGMARSPSYYHPIKQTENAIKRRNIVLKQMKSAGFISESIYQNAIEEPFVPAFSSFDDSMVFAVSSVKKDYFRRFPLLMRGHKDLHVITTIDAPLQRNLAKSFEKMFLKQDSLNGAALVLSLKDGSILGVQGSPDGSKNSFNMAFYTKREVFDLLDDLPLKKEAIYSLLDLGRTYVSLLTPFVKKSKNMIHSVYDESFHLIWNNHKDQTYQKLFSAEEKAFIKKSLMNKKEFIYHRPFLFGVDPALRLVHGIYFNSDMMIITLIEHEDSRKKLPLAVPAIKNMMAQMMLDVSQIFIAGIPQNAP